MRYETGLYGGSFDPLHLGHVDCILQGANLCRRFYIVLSVGARRDQTDGRVRYRWLYQLTRHLSNVTILTIEDDAPAKAAYTREDWLRDAERIKAQIGRPVDVVFCGSDYGPDSAWKTCYPGSEIYVFPRNEMSSTQIRQDPYGHWDWLPRIVRPAFTKKVLLMGSESVGKSTLTIHLAHRFNAGYIDEAGRDISARSGTDRMMLSQDFTEILLQHKLNEMRALERGDKLLFIDTDALVTQFYMLFLDDPNKARNIALSDAIDALNDYDLILFLEPDVDFVQDGDRSQIIQADRQHYSDQIKTLLREHHRSFFTLSGDYQARYQRAVELTEQLMEGKL